MHTDVCGTQAAQDKDLRKFWSPDRIKAELRKPVVKQCIAEHPALTQLKGGSDLLVGFGMLPIVAAMALFYSMLLCNPPPWGRCATAQHQGASARPATQLHDIAVQGGAGYAPQADSLMK